MRGMVCAVWLAAVCPLSADVVSPVDPAWERYGQRSEAHFRAYSERVSQSRHEADRTLSLLAELAGAGPAAADELGRQWAISGPSERSLRLTAIWTCAAPADTPQRRFCDQLQLLQRWQRFDSKNAMLWAMLAARADEESDVAAFDSASRSMLSSNHFNSGYTDSLRLIRERMAADSIYAQQPRGDRAMYALGLALAVPLSYGNLPQLCPYGRNPIRFDRMDFCRHLSAQMTESEDSLLSGVLGNAVAKAYALDDEERARLAEREAVDRSLMTAFHADQRLLAPPGNDGLADDYDDYLQLLITHGAREAMIRWLASAAPDGDPMP